MDTQIKTMTAAFRWPHWVLFAVFLVSLITRAACAEITVEVDRNPVRLNESFTLTFTATDSSGGEPDFSGLEQDFEILNRSQSSNTTIINGDFNSSMTWTLTLMAKRSGSLNVPAIPFGQDPSRPLTIEVLDENAHVASDDSEILLEVAANPANPYIQAQVIYTIRFLRRIQVAQANLSEPQLDQAIVQKLGEDREFTMQRGGHQYLVTERKYAIFPQISGQMAIAPLVLQANVVTSRSFGFFDQPRTRIERIRSEAVTLDVKPIPAEFQGKYWLPAQQISLEEQWSSDPPAIRVGEPLTRTLKLAASGTTLGLLPEFGKLEFAGQDGNAFKQYPDQPVTEEKKSASGIIASREQKVALIPSTAGTFRTKAFKIAWWNTRSDRLEFAELPASVIEALPAVANSTPTPAQPASKAELEQSPSLEAQKADESALTHTEAGHAFWLALSVFLGIGWTSTLLILFWRKRSARARKADVGSPRANEGPTVKELKTACRNHDPQAAKNALLVWSKLRWPKPIANLGELALRCEAPLDREIRALNAALYSRERGNWNGTALWEAFSKCAQAVKPKDKKRGVDLEPLFKT